MMRQRRKNGFFYLFGVILIEWGVSVLIQAVAEFIYIAGHYERLQNVMGSQEEMMNLALEMALEISQYATEIAMATAVIMIPILLYMYHKDKKCSQFTLGENAIAEMPGENWWQSKAKLGTKDYAALVVLGITACIVMNNLILLSGVQASSEGYQIASGNIYHSPKWIQFIGLGIVIPVMEELMYRGMLLRRMRETLPMGMALVFTAVFFGISHGNLVQFLFAASLGALLGYFYEKVRSVHVPILLHVVINLTSILATWAGLFTWTFENIIRVGAVTAVAAGVGAAMFLRLKNIGQV